MKKLTPYLLLIAAAFAACQNKPGTPATPETTVPETTAERSPGKPLTKTTCYENRFGKDVTAIELTVVGDQVDGFYAWEPHEKDGARGMFKGKKTGDEITADFIYMIEGSIQSEEIIFKIAGDKLLKGEGELQEKGEKLVIKDKTKLSWKETFNIVDCAVIREPIARAVDVYGRIVKQQGAGN